MFSFGVQADLLQCLDPQQVTSLVGWQKIVGFFMSFFVFVHGMQADLLQCLDALCQFSEQVVAHHKAVTAHLLPALAAAVGRPGESRDSRFLCLKLLCDVILHFLLETDLYSAPLQSQPAGPGQCF